MLPELKLQCTMPKGCLVSFKWSSSFPKLMVSSVCNDTFLKFDLYWRAGLHLGSVHKYGITWNWLHFKTKKLGQIIFLSCFETFDFLFEFLVIKSTVCCKRIYRCMWKRNLRIQLIFANVIRCSRQRTWVGYIIYFKFTSVFFQWVFLIDVL